jgi:hypothetical protein
MHNLIFPALPGSRKVAPFWEKEAEAAKTAGFGISIVSDPNDAELSMTNRGNPSLYRGWIVRPPYYQAMGQLASLLTSYDDYLWSFEFPRWYQVFTNHETPNSFTYSGEDIQKLGLQGIAEQVSQRVGSQPLLIKDWLKSRKHEWFDACFIKDASDVAETVRVMSNFFTLQGRDFYGGLVFREFLSLKKLGVHPKSGMPLPIEFRTFFLHQQPMITTMYWDNDVPYPTDVESPPQDWLQDIGKKMVSPFVALDIAQSEDGKWWVIEVNDGGTAGYPDRIDHQEFYGLLHKGMTHG